LPLLLLLLLPLLLLLLLLPLAFFSSQWQRCCCFFSPFRCSCSALVPTKGQPLKGRVPPGLGLSPLWTPNAAAPMENQDDDDDE
jgi:hypothetical protein